LSSAPSYKSLIDQLIAFADGHFIIRKFTFGEETDYDLEKEGQYPAMHVLHPTVSVEKGAINYDLVIQFADLPRDIETKTTYQMEQISDLFRLGQDLLNTIVNENDVMLFGEDAEIIGTPRMEAFAQETKNNLVVVSLSFTLQLPNDWSACDIPADWTIGQSGGDTPGVPVVYVISVTGLDTDNTDPQNPIVRIAVDGVTITGDGTPGDPLVAAGGSGTVTSVDVTADGDAITTDGGPITTSGTINIEFNGASTDYIDGEGNLQTFPTIPPDPTNVYVPLAGTDNGYPVTGPIQGADLTLIDDISDPASFVSYVRVGSEVRINFLDVINGYNTRFIVEQGIINVASENPEFVGIEYNDDYSANFVYRSLVDFGFVKGFIYHANAAPTVNDDSSDEFEVGTLWIDYSVSPPELYVCEDASVGAAVWTQVGAGGSTSPGGSDTQVQFNDGGAFGGEADFTYNKSTNTLTVDKVTVDDEAYGSGWNASLEVPTKNAVYDKIQTMPQQDSLILGAGTITTQTVASGATAYGYLNGNAAAITTNANNVQSLIPVAGTLSRYYLYTTGSQSATGSLVVTVRSNSVDSAITITIAAGSSAGNYSDTTNTLAISAGDSCDVKFVNNASAASITLRSWASILTR